jgi:hypothetical protein
VGEQPHRHDAVHAVGGVASAESSRVERRALRLERDIAGRAARAGFPPNPDVRLVVAAIGEPVIDMDHGLRLLSPGELGEPLLRGEMP